jgi:hypothetical protein
MPIHDPKHFNRRELLMSTLFGAGWVGLRALATGLPASFFLSPRRALADPTCGDKSRAQYIIFQTSGAGDPINASVPGTYEDAKIVHSPDPALAPAQLMIQGRRYTAAMPWAMLPQSVLDRTCFWHLMTNTPIHPKEPDVLKLMGAITSTEMFPSLLAKQLAPCLGTVQSQPITVGAASPSEGLSFNGAALPIIPPVALRATLTTPNSPLGKLQSLRDQTLAQVNALYRNGASPAQKAYIDSWVNTQEQARSIRQDLLAQLDAIKDNSVASQITAALAIIQMNVSPVVAIHIPFGGDNHNDNGLATETAQTLTGVAAIGSLIGQLQSAGLGDKVTFASLNVFGRTLGPGNDNGRQHNQNHQVSITIGKPIKGGVIGGVAPVMGDYGATAIDSATGSSVPAGDIVAAESLGAFARTLMTGVGIDPSVISYSILNGKVITSALA